MCMSSSPERLKLEEDFIFHEVNILSYPLFKYKPYTVILASTIANLFKEHKIDLFHGHYAIPHSMSLYLAKQSNEKIKIISTLHGSDIHLLGLDNVYKTTDGGMHWKLDFSPEHLGANEIFFLNENHGWILAWNGNIYKYTGY